MSTEDVQCGTCGWMASEHGIDGQHPEPARALCGSCDAGLTMCCTCIPAPPIVGEVRY